MPIRRKAARTAWLMSTLITVGASAGLAGCAAMRALDQAAGTAGAVVGGAAKATSGVTHQTVDAMTGASAPASSGR